MYGTTLMMNKPFWDFTQLYSLKPTLNILRSTERVCKVTGNQYLEAKTHFGIISISWGTLNSLRKIIMAIAW